MTGKKAGPVLGEEQTVTTEYGIQTPNGDVMWGPDTRGTFSFSPADLAADPQARRKWTAQLRDMAKSVGITPAQFINNHKILKRDTIVTKSAPVELTFTDPVSAPGEPAAE